MRPSKNKWFTALRCSSLQYQFEVSLDKFNLHDFKSEVARMVGEVIPKAESFVGSTATRGSADYHCHFSFHWNRRTFRASLEYIKSKARPEPDDSGPFSEDVMAWLGQFFKNGRAASELLAYFTYPMKEIRCSLPMPMRIPLGEDEVEITAMVVRLPIRIKGAYEIFASLHHDEFTIAVSAERPVNFKEFNLGRDLLALSSVARKFTREKAK
jgi:hypothetical protein